MNFLKIAGEDIKSIFKNRFIRVSVIAIIIVPLLYSLLYLDAFWDPYARIQDMTIAVVNEDGGALLDGKQVNYGEDIVENLKGNEEVGWDFTSNEKANEGLEKQGYYAKFVIPEDFSKSVVAAKEGKPQIADLQFVCNEKKNFLAAQINSQVEKLLKEEIVGTISNNYVTVAFDKLYEAKDGFIKAADGSEKLYNGIGELNEKVPMLAEGAKKLGDGSEQLKDGQGALNSGIKSINNGLSEVNSKVPTLGSGVDKLYNGSQELKNGLSEVNSKVPALSSGVDKLYVGSEELKNGLGTAVNGAGALTSGSKGLYGAFNATIYPNVNSLKDGANKLNGKLKAGESNIKDLKKGGEGLKTSSDSVAALSTGVNTKYQSVTDEVNELIDSVNKSSATMNKISTEISKAVESNPGLANDPNIKEALQKIQDLNKETSETQKKIEELEEGSKKFGDSLGTFNGVVNGYTGSVKEFATGTVALTDSVNDMGVAVSKISGGLNSLEAGLNENTKDSFGAGLKSLSDNMSGLNAGINKLNSGSSEINGGLGQLRSNIPTLSGGIQALYSGSGELNGGLGQLRSNVPALSGGIQALYNGSNQLVDGSNALVDGQNKLNDGVSELTGKVPQLEDGVDKLYKGSNELATALKDGAGEMKSGLKNSSKEMGDFVSAPINMKNEPINKVPNYGTGFAPYFISLSLWIGAIMMFFVISAKTDDDANLSKFDKVIGKYLSFGFIGLLQALLVSAVVMGLGLTPTSTGMYFASIVFLSLVFIAIIQCLISLFGDAGRLLGIVLLILQLTACAGTFPLEIVPKFFKVINPYMPFTYSVELLREVISANTINYGIVGKDFLILGIVLLVFLTISIVFKNAGENLQNIIEGRKGKSVENIKEQSM
ncbi:YhgE/Pip domain-containing protein [Clostridium sp. UBA7503]|uniref:YhgE/Pip domain-containing protein n=1 Tax=Clostridium sp. UBA7503 TaxID=1946377 RepID=UPI00321769C5